MDEISIISRLREVFKTANESDLRVGIGDDAAVFATHGNSVALATDILTEGTHFERRWSDLYSIGRKAAAANLADIFAMGIPAKYLVVAVAFQPAESEEIIDLARGIADECALVGARVIGGDLSRADRLTVSITALGEVSTDRRIVTRSGAKQGDGLFLSSLPGRSSLGLEQLRGGITIDEESISFHKSPTVDYKDFLTVASFASSLCDISDGVMMDAYALARASNVAMMIDRSLIESHPQYEEIAEVARGLELDPIDVILTSGEEHSPLFTAEHDHLHGGRFHRIGSVQRSEHPAIFIDGVERSVEGFRHFD